MAHVISNPVRWRILDGTAHSHLHVASVNVVVSSIQRDLLPLFPLASECHAIVWSMKVTAWSTPIMARRLVFASCRAGSTGRFFAISDVAGKQHGGGGRPP